MMINSNSLLCRVLLILAGLVFSAAAAGQAWVPKQHVELIVPAPAGGSLDATGRIIQRIWQDQKIIPVTSTVVNRAGGGHAVAYAYLAQHAGHPYILDIDSPTLLTNHINGRTSVTYTDFTPLATLVNDYMVFAVQSDSKFQTGKELIEALRNRPDSVSIALSSARGGTHHIALGLPLQSAGVDIGKVRIVAFDSSGQTVTALLGGHVDVAVASAGNVALQVAAGKLRVLAVSSPHRLAGTLAAAPTWQELGQKGVFENWRGVFGTRGLTAEQITFWQEALRRVTAAEEFQKYAKSNLWDISYRTPEESRLFMAAQYADLKNVMDYLGLVKH